MHHWISKQLPRDETFRVQVQALCDLYTQPLDAQERVFSIDDKTSLQPRTRTSPTRPAWPGGTPVQLEHEYQRMGALNLLPAFDTRTGDVIGICRQRKRQLEFIELLEAIDRARPLTTTLFYIVLDNVITHKGKLVRTCLAKQPRFQFHEWNAEAAPFNWTEKSFEKTLAKVDATLKVARSSNTERHDHGGDHVRDWSPTSGDR